MKYVMNASDFIDERSRCAFYTHAILPQFGITKTEVTWYDSKIWVDGDEAMYCFEAADQKYALLFYDYLDFESKSSYEAILRKEALAEGQTFEFVYPKTRKASDPNPTYDGFDLARGGYALFCPYVTGTYTLLRIAD